MASVSASPIDSSDCVVDHLLVVKVRENRCTTSLIPSNPTVMTSVAVVFKEGLDVLPLGCCPCWTGIKPWVRLKLAGTNE